MASLVEEMRSDWNARAAEDAHYFVAYGRRNQPLDAFLSSAENVVERVRRDLPRITSLGDGEKPVVLEIGCGVGRLIHFLRHDSSSIIGVDISEEMVSRASVFLRNDPAVKLHTLADNNLDCIPSHSVDFIYSYAVFQHLPSCMLMFKYLSEAHRVIKTGGIFVFQANTAQVLADQNDTWVGEWVSTDTIVQHLSDIGWKILSIEGRDTQYTWITVSPKERPEFTPLPPPSVDIENIYGMGGMDGSVISGGPLGYMTIYVKGIPDSLCDIADLKCTVGTETSPIVYIGAGHESTWRQFNILIASSLTTGDYPMRLWWKDQAISDCYVVPVRQRSPLVPQVVAVTDGEEVGLNNEVHSGALQITVREITIPREVSATIEGQHLEQRYALCSEPLAPHWILTFAADSVPKGVSQLEVYAGEQRIHKSSIIIIGDDYEKATV